MTGQANLDPTTAAALHVQYMTPLAGQARIGAPAVSNSGNAGEGLNWLSEWITACESHASGPCHFDFCNIHWYSALEWADKLFTQLDDAYKLCGRPAG